jgi:branched-chain amino acid transport system substrate-binding protein
VHVGHVSALSGTPGATIGGARMGAQAWVKWINRHCGLNGHPVKLFLEDSASDPTRYVGILKRLVEQERAIALFGNMTPLEGDAGVAYLNEKRVPLVGGDGWSSYYCQGGMYFYTGPCLNTMAVGVAQAAVKQGKPKLALFYCGEANLCRDYREATYSPAATKTGAEIVVSKQISITQPDFTSECLAAKEKGAQAISMYMDAGSMSRLARSCANQDYHPMFLGGGAMAGPKHTEDPYLSELYTAYNVVPWIVTDLPAVAEYRSAIAEFGSPIWPSSGVVWADGMLLRAAAAKLPADNPTPQSVLDGLYSMKNETLGGLIQPATFSPDQKTRGSSCFFPLVIKDKKWLAPLGAKQECLQ